MSKRLGDLKDRIRVKGGFRPLKKSLRSYPVLELGRVYYASWESNWVYAGKLISIDHYPKQTWVVIEFPVNSKDKETGDQMTIKHEFLDNEIGSTPEQAIENQVSSLPI